MKFLIVFVALFALALAAPPQNEVGVVRQESDVSPTGFKYNLELTDGIKTEAEGQLKTFDKEEAAVVVRGSFSYVADDGQTYTINYIADENGYQPQGAHLPVAPVA
ncbi:larval cuticle protein 65Ag1-like [Drosophila novamexicana]|uniref:larval cuticle protein 65Ag1-like n=1 Tax=Drosophila novamexicana TaxID=47314 RepID=UPI0011E5F6AF|nr:larval cuticle protein 65Ag1-like [Drosophila novamexicana]